MLINLDERKYYESAFRKLNSESCSSQNIDQKSSDEVAMIRSGYLKHLQLALKAERASAKNLFAKQGKTVLEYLLQESRQAVCHDYRRG